MKGWHISTRSDAHVLCLPAEQSEYYGTYYVPRHSQCLVHSVQHQKRLEKTTREVVAEHNC